MKTNAGLNRLQKDIPKHTHMHNSTTMCVCVCFQTVDYVSAQGRGETKHNTRHSRGRERHDSIKIMFQKVECVKPVTLNKHTALI